MKTIITFILIFTASIVFGQDYRSLVAKADAHYNNKEYVPSVALFKEAFKINQTKQSHLYNAGCAAALAGEPKLAFQWLNLAVHNGWINVEHTQKDSDLTSLHGTKKWDKLIIAIQKKQDEVEAAYDKPLKAELSQILDDDQKYRMKSGEIGQKYGNESPEMKNLWLLITEKDSINLIKVKAILDKYGWFGADKVGQSHNALFLVIQHADLATQQKYLPMIREAVKNKKERSASLALLEDRVAIRLGKRQIYGSQIGRDKETGKPYVLPLEDPDNVDARRATADLEPIANYAKRFNFEWNLEAYKLELPKIEAKQPKN